MILEITLLLFDSCTWDLYVLIMLILFGFQLILIWFCIFVLYSISLFSFGVQLILLWFGSCKPMFLSHCYALDFNWWLEFFAIILPWSSTFWIILRFNHFEVACYPLWNFSQLWFLWNFLYLCIGLYWNFDSALCYSNVACTLFGTSFCISNVSILLGFPKSCLE